MNSGAATPVGNSFAEILQRLVERVPGATGAVFADWEGESVGEFALDLPQLEIQIMGAQWGVVWIDVQRAFRRAHLGAPEELIVDFDRGSLLVRQVTDQYYVVLAVNREGHLAKALAELDRGVAELRAEM
jgi:predicted regulator of Ras-like GTPase activity (Roadblock/LC7/MglB family)